MTTENREVDFDEYATCMSELLKAMTTQNAVDRKFIFR